MKDATERWAQLAGVSPPSAASPPPTPSTRRPQQTLEHRIKSGGPLPPSADARDGALGNRPLTELGTARRLLDKYAGTLRFIPERKAWLLWRDGRWQWDRDGADVRTLAAELHKDIYLEGSDAGPEARHFSDWARKCQTEQVIRRVVSLASDDPVIRVPVAHLDAMPELIGLAGGRVALDLRSGRQRPATEEDLITRSLGLEEMGQAEFATRWTQLLEEVFGDGEVIEWLQRYLGYALTGYAREHLLLFGWGTGANGKSVLINVCRQIWGGYARVIQPETLMNRQRQSGAPAPDLVHLVGSRLVIGSETEEGQTLSEGLVKQLTSSDAITVRDLYQSPFEFVPTFKLFVAGNHRPNVKSADHGIWRRIALLPFEQTFALASRDALLPDKLALEVPHILAWLVEGSRRYLKEGLGTLPGKIQGANVDYKTEQDVLAEWIAGHTRQDGAETAANLYASYRTWASEAQCSPISKQAFGRRLGERGLIKRHTNRGAGYVGISLLNSPGRNTDDHRDGW